jgi:L-Ala-D/L-Glu epimerase
LRGISYLPGGVIDVPEVPGLGAVIDEAYLSKSEKVII